MNYTLVVHAALALLHSLSVTLFSICSDIIYVHKNGIYFKHKILHNILKTINDLCIFLHYSRNIFIFTTNLIHENCQFYTRILVCSEKTQIIRISTVLKLLFVRSMNWKIEHMFYKIKNYDDIEL